MYLTASWWNTLAATPATAEFSEYLDDVSKIVVEKFGGGCYIRIDGDVDGRDRQVAIDLFNTKNDNRYRFCLITSKPGGVGITLTAADLIILITSRWNPSVDLQVIARIHRIGQTLPVISVRLIVAGHRDEVIYRTAQRKQMIACVLPHMPNYQTVMTIDAESIDVDDSAELDVDENADMCMTPMVQSRT